MEHHLSDDESEHSRRVRAAMLVCQLFLGITLVASGIPKLRTPHVFFSEVLDDGLVGSELLLAVMVAITVPWIEIVLAIMILSRIVMAGALFLCMSLAGLTAAGSLLTHDNEMHSSGWFAVPFTNAEPHLLQALLVAATAGAGLVCVYFRRGVGSG